MTESSGKFTVVIADDMADLRSIAAHALESSGHFEVVGQAEDGAAAVALAEHHQPDLMLLDLAMPVLDGLQALPRIRDVSPKTRVVILSIFEEGRMGSLAKAGGAVGYLEKAVHPSHLADELLALSGILEVAQRAINEAMATFDPELQSPSSARHFVEETLKHWDYEPLLDTVNLLVSELVTNAVVHAESQVEVGVRLTSSVLRVEVSDHSPEVPAAGTPSDEDLSGRGLMLVEALASDWGIENRTEGKTVWFEVPTPQR